MGSTHWIRSLPCLAAAGFLSLTGLIGCAPTETEAEFTAGQGQDTLDGATINDDGSTFELDMDDSRQLLARVEIDGGDRYIDFETQISEELGVSVPSTIGAGKNILEVNPTTSLATLTVEVPLSGTQTFTFDTGNALAMFGLDSRAALQQQTPGCTRAVAGVDEFCELFQTNATEALTQVMGLAQEYADDAGLPDIADGFIEGVVTDFYDVIDDFCNAWTEVRDGSTAKAPVDPCAM